ncbi:YrrS family protein [Pontibacillus litoralis]|uniref:DUF1510 domain-containing protein n=1 Tax=Pontibacillus litoralis JSM 072002 TaxID=1385512 RepID=A0A0A5GCP4_9BACI|nr:YrrS family protein [Pontibacillus litoralis]KGX88958.1 hypothetical protein N784_01070 [Pontibacillus litoralis JSM 072002]
MSDQSRLNRYDKRRKNTKLITNLSVAGGVLAISLLLIILLPFGGDDAPKAIDGNNQEKQEEKDVQQTEVEVEEIDQEEEEKDEVKVTPSNEENVVEVWEKDWSPVATEQTNHGTILQQGSQDWAEMEEAFRVATGLSEGDMINWWSTRWKGDQSVIGTVSNGAKTEHYKVYVEWIDNEGWKPIKVEVLENNDAPTYS